MSGVGRQWTFWNDMQTEGCEILLSTVLLGTHIKQPKTVMMLTTHTPGGPQPLKAYPAVRTREVTHFHQLHADCGQRIRYAKQCPVHSVKKGATKATPKKGARNARVSTSGRLKGFRACSSD